jgi:hypothetical protein
MMTLFTLPAMFISCDPVSGKTPCLPRHQEADRLLGLSSKCLKKMGRETSAKERKEKRKEEGSYAIKGTKSREKHRSMRQGEETKEVSPSRSCAQANLGRKSWTGAFPSVPSFPFFPRPARIPSHHQEPAPVRGRR